MLFQGGFEIGDEFFAVQFGRVFALKNRLGVYHDCGIEWWNGVQSIGRAVSCESGHWGSWPRNVLLTQPSHMSYINMRGNSITVTQVKTSRQRFSS